MANIKSKKKRIKTNLKSRDRNVSYVSSMKTAVKRCRASIMDGEKEAFDNLVLAQKIIDKTASKGCIKKQNASRKKARLMILFNKTVADKTVQPAKSENVEVPAKKVSKAVKSAKRTSKTSAAKTSAKSSVDKPVKKVAAKKVVKKASAKAKDSAS